MSIIRMRAKSFLANFTLLASLTFITVAIDFKSMFRGSKSLFVKFPLYLFHRTVFQRNGSPAFFTDDVMMMTFLQAQFVQNPATLWSDLADNASVQQQVQIL